MKTLLVLIPLFLTAVQAWSANWYVRPGGTGGRTGADWNNAWDLGSIGWTSVQPGDTVWVAGGSYGGVTVRKSGTAGSPILIRRVLSTDSVPASAAGWSSSFDSQVVTGSWLWPFVNAGVQGLGSYVTVDGRVDSGISARIGTAGDCVDILNQNSYITLMYFEMAGGGASSPVTMTGDSRGINAKPYRNISGASGPSAYDTIDHLVLSHCRIHGQVNNIYFIKCYQSTVEYCDIYDSGAANSATYHPNMFADYFSSEITFRYNNVYNYMAEGIMCQESGSGWYIYGNLWHDGMGGQTGNTHRILEAQYSVVSNVKFYNNTCVNLDLGIRDANSGSWGSGCAGGNNIYWNCPGPSGTWPGESSDLQGSGSSSTPFVNYGARNYRLASARPGINLGSPYNMDVDGNQRGGDGVWDIGAYEFGGTPPPPDTVPPTVSLVAPLANATVSNTVTLSVSATDNAGGSGVATVTFLVDGTSVGTDTASPYTFSWNSRGVANGSHTIQARAVDGAGNSAVSSTISVSVNNPPPDTTVPTVSLTGPSANSLLSNTVTLSASATDNSGGSGVASVTFLVDGASVGSASASPYTVSWDSHVVANGAHTIVARAVDNSGNSALSGVVTVTVNNPTLMLSDGLIGHWKMDEASGSLVKDASGNGNNGTLVGTATWASGEFGGALSLNGTTGYVRVPSTPALEKVSSVVTISTWVNASTTTVDMQSVARKVIDENANIAPYAAYDLILNNNGTTFTARMGVTSANGTTRGLATGAAHAYGLWYHLAGVYDGSKVHLYVNGVEEASAAFTGPVLQTAQPLCIGRYGAVTEPVNGLIDDFRLYNRALSPAEIQTLASPPSPPSGLRILGSN